jgi:uncharacterized membrane-anchored protein YhcB (DUF1043 family)
METFYIFGFGVIFALSIIGIIYSVMVISKVKKQSDEAIEEVEELQVLLSETRTELENLINESNDRLDREILDFEKFIEVFNAKSDSRFDKLESRLREEMVNRFQEIELIIGQIQQNSQIMRESL